MKNFNTQLINAILDGKLHEVFMLVQSSEMINTPGNYGYYPLHYCSIAKRYGSEICSILISRGANININSEKNNKETPLHFAVERGNIKMIDILLELGAKVDSLDKFGDTPLIVAITSENPKGFSIISKLIKAGANPFYQPKNRKSANDLIEEWGNNYPDYQKIKNLFSKTKTK